MVLLTSSNIPWPEVVMAYTSLIIMEENATDILITKKAWSMPVIAITETGSLLELTKQRCRTDN